MFWRAFLRLLSVVRWPLLGAQESADSENVQLAVRQGDSWVPIDENLIRDSLLEIEDGERDRENHNADQNEVQPNLIDLSQWTHCWVLNYEDDGFATYVFPWNGVERDVRLRCGTEKYGYKHIANSHEGQWNTLLQRGITAEWDNGAIGVNSWDHLMNLTAMSLVSMPGNLAWSEATQKFCTNDVLGWVDLTTGEVKLEYRSEVAWAMDNDKLLTAFPSHREYCNPQ